MKIYTLLGISFIFLISCKDRSIDQSKLTDKSGEENFTHFFEKFKRDSLFQVERVKFPWTIPSNKGQESIITKSEWEHANFQYKEEFATRPIDAYKQEIVTYGDTTRIFQYGVSNGMSIEFVFARVQGKWFLYYEKDLSKY